MARCCSRSHRGLGRRNGHPGGHRRRGTGCRPRLRCRQRTHRRRGGGVRARGVDRRNPDRPRGGDQHLRRAPARARCPVASLCPRPRALPGDTGHQGSRRHALRGAPLRRGECLDRAARRRCRLRNPQPRGRAVSPAGGALASPGGRAAALSGQPPGGSAGRTRGARPDGRSMGLDDRLVTGRTRSPASHRGRGRRAWSPRARRSSVRRGAGSGGHHCLAGAAAHGRTG